MSNVKSSREKLSSVKKKDNENREGLMSMGRKKTFEDIMKLNMKVQKMLEEERKAKESGEDQVGEIKDEPRVVERRIRSIESKLNDILRGVKGEKESFLPFVEDENRRLSNPKIKDFIAELIDSHPDAKELSKEKRKLLELFFYCVILGPSGIKSEVSMEILAPNYICTEAFEEFIHAADDPVFQEKDRMKLVRDEESDRAYIEYGFGFSFFLNLWLEADAERSFYTPEELKEAAEVYADIRMEDPEEVLKAWTGTMESDAGNEAESTAAEPQNEPETLNATETSVSSATEESTSTAVRKKEVVMEADGPLKGMTITVYEEEPADYGSEDPYEDCEVPIGYEVNDDDPIECPQPDWEAMQYVEEECFRRCSASLEVFEHHLPEQEVLQESYLELRKMLYTVDYSDIAEFTRVCVENFILHHQISPICYKSKFEKINDLIFECMEEISRIERGDEN